ncbi:glycosyltransferase [Aneurinibacillus danicus]|uniref:Glycosyl transferase n=1 Tax=Aneurinibacillus danicus TaxID=267746 RepID=A0A511V9U0_9BACL|nr:glycosyltransferase [Aneurinibacillus danicus]GEN35031.1 glycosyl transferase [Aneurinibacillus danicus]
MHPATLQHLVSLEKDIVSEIFWTSWQEGERKFPQVWLSDQYTLYHRSPHETLSDEDVQARTMEFLQQLRKPGVYEVGGLGACTLISRRALLAGVNFNTIPNISLIGEDRHFCVRATALGFSLFVDTYYPAYHIYRDSDLAGVEMYKYRNTVKTSTNKVTLSMVIKNEADRYLRRVLEECRHYIDEAVIIDDGSTDESVEICKKVLAGIPLHIVRNETSRFANEIELRKQQWEETIKTLPDWILNLDADEMFEKKLREVMPMIVNQHEYDVICFPLYDMWDEDHYRDDEYWCAHKTYRPFLVRYQPDFVYKWKETAQHCGRFPENILELSTGRLDIRLKHYGWASPEDRQKKYERYMQLDPEARYGWKEQYESILDPAPTLRKWEE